MSTRDPGTLVELDARGRVSLGKIARADRYLLRVEPGGVLVLEPAVVVSALQARIDAAPALRAQIAEANTHPEQAVPHRRRTRRD